MSQVENVVDNPLTDQLEILKRSANTIRGLAMDGVQKANSGHPGMPMGMADAAVVLWTRHMKHNPADVNWPDRDRFVLSAGHGSMLLYSLLHLTGYESMTLDDLRNFRQWGSKTPGHPEDFLADAVETTTGPLGQGISNAIGMALAERHLAAVYNRPDYAVMNHYTYVIASDGDMMEGISHESCSLAGHLGLGRLIVLYDDNNITIDGDTKLSFSEDVCKRFEAYRWHVQRINGHEMEEVDYALDVAKSVLDRPSLIACRTTIGYGSPNRAGTAEAHGEPLGDEEVKRSKERLGIPLEPLFHVPEEVRDFMGQAREQGATRQKAWDEMMERYRAEFPEQAEQFHMSMEDRLPDGWDQDMPEFEVGKSIATRAASGKVLGALVPRIPSLIGGSADLTPSNKTQVMENWYIHRSDYSPRYIHFGVREHGMGSIMTGIAQHGMRPFGGTFLIFSDYMRPVIRLAAMMKKRVTYVFTHDGIGLGEDGPTHQPIEHLASLRAIPRLCLIRPADAAETVEAWKVAMNGWDGPVALALTRQGLPVLDRTKYAPADGLQRGAYVLADVDDPQVILIGTGSEVHIALAAREQLDEDGIRARVVSMPSWELFEQQNEEYRNTVFPAEIAARVVVEAAAPLGWERYIGGKGRAVGLNRFGASAPYQTIYQNLGITAEAVADAAREVLRGV